MNPIKAKEKRVGILTDVSHVVLVSLEVSDSIEIAAHEGVEVSSDVLQQFLIMVVFDATIVERGRRF